MKVLVTGASGFIGAALCQHLSSSGIAVVPVVRKPNAAPGEQFLAANDARAWHEALQGCQSAVHLAGRVHVMHERADDPLQSFREANVQATITLAEQAAQAGVRRFVFVSSIKVNGEQTTPGACFAAQDNPNPADPYAVSKWEAEQALHKIAQSTGMELVIIRPPLVYGPGVKGNFAQMLRWAGKSVPLPLGGVKNQRSMIALDNLVSLLALCSQPDRSPRAAGQTFLVCDGSPVSTPELLRKIARAYGRPIWLAPIPPALLRRMAQLVGQGPAADRLLGSLVIDDRPVRQLLNWQPPVSMEEQLRRMAGAAST
jgi:nucleoside-diphosphate-sugar epimerase